MNEYFLAECYGPKASPGWLETASRAIDQAGRDVDIRCVDAILVPEDEVTFFLLDAPTREAAMTTLEEAGVRVDRVTRSERSSLHRTG